MCDMKMYSLKSVPVFKPRIQGGRRLQEVFGKELPPGQKIGGTVGTETGLDIVRIALTSRDTS